MEAILVLALTAATSAAAYAFGRRRGWLHGTLVSALTRTAECVGLTLVFLAANLALGVVGVLLLRALPVPFVSVYTLDDATFVVIAAVQAVIFHWWMVIQP